VLSAGVAEARAINLHGVADLTYRWSRIDQRVGGADLTPSTTTGLLQHYQLGSTGDLLHPNLGSYTANASLIDDTARTNGVDSQDLRVTDYYLSVNLLPRSTPVNFYAQRINQFNELNDPGSTSITTTYSLTWDIPLHRLPRLRVNLFQSELQVDSELVSSLQRTRAAALDVDGQAGATRYFARYQLTRFEGESQGASQGSTSHTISASAETRFTPALSAAARVNYSSSVQTLGVVTPGLGTLQQRSAGASVYYRPSLQTTLSASYDFYKDPFERHLFATTANLRPLQELDVAAGYRFFRFDVQDALTTSHYAFTSANYRPMLGLSTTLSASVVRPDRRPRRDGRRDELLPELRLRCELPQDLDARDVPPGLPRGIQRQPDHDGDGNVARPHPRLHGRGQQHPDEAGRALGRLYVHPGHPPHIGCGGLRPAEPPPSGCGEQQRSARSVLIGRFFGADGAVIVYTVVVPRPDGPPFPV
jgi:hypothetical protein